MTTIAWDGTTLAADRLAVRDYTRYQVTKIFRFPDGRLFGASGEHTVCTIMRDWLSKPQTERGPRPAIQSDKEYSAHCLEIVSLNEVYFHNHLGRVQIEDRFAVSGSGEQFALAALYCGRTAREAVELASKLDNGTGNGIDTLDLGPNSTALLSALGTTDKLVSLLREMPK